MPTGEGGPGAALVEEAPKQWKLRQYDFRIQFCWQPKPRGKRLEEAEKKRKLAESGAPVEETTATVTDENTSG